MGLVIRDANQYDLPFIQDTLNHEILNGTATFDYQPKTSEEIKDFYKSRVENNFPLIVALVNKQLAGFATYGPFRQKEGYKYTVEHSIYIPTQFQGKGIGRYLLNYLIVQAKQNNLKSMIAGIDNSNTASIEFHKKFGFQEVGRIPKAAFKFDKWLELVFLQLILEDQ
ncbi:MAG: N-acetyltransferase [Flavobacteriales bacterium]|nr:N-acetyltransferase [Flavobacteriales bacterium]